MTHTIDELSHAISEQYLGAPTAARDDMIAAAEIPARFYGAPVHATFVVDQLPLH